MKKPSAPVVAAGTPLKRNCTPAVALSGSVKLAARGTLSPTVTVTPSGGLVTTRLPWPWEATTARARVPTPVPPALAAKRRTV